MKIFFLVILFSQVFLFSCSKVRESAGVNRKNLDEFKVIENPPLVIPPDFNLLPPEQLSEKNIDEVESELAEEILFGLDETNSNFNENISTMEKILLQTKANDLDSNFRNEFDEEFSNEKSSSIYQIGWEEEVEVLDAIKESERIRKNLLEGESISKGEVPILNQEIKTNKNKKKKRFFFF